MFSVQNSVVHARGVLQDFRVKHKMTQAEGECLCTLSKSPATSQEHGWRYPAQENNYSETQANASEFKFLVGDCLITQGNAQVAQSSEQPTVTSEVVGTIPTSDPWHLCEELVNALPAVVSLRRVLRFGNVDRVVGTVRSQQSTGPTTS